MIFGNQYGFAWAELLVLEPFLSPFPFFRGHAFQPMSLQVGFRGYGKRLDATRVAHLRLVIHLDLGRHDDAGAYHLQLCLTPDFQLN